VQSDLVHVHGQIYRLPPHIKALAFLHVRSCPMRERSQGSYLPAMVNTILQATRTEQMRATANS